MESRKEDWEVAVSHARQLGLTIARGGSNEELRKSRIYHGGRLLYRQEIEVFVLGWSKCHEMASNEGAKQMEKQDVYEVDIEDNDAEESFERETKKHRCRSCGRCVKRLLEDGICLACVQVFAEA